MLAAAKEGKRVVRLKGGDPMIFAHGGEEVEFLERNFIEVNVIPGISTAMAASALCKIPLTYRGISSSVAFASGHSTASRIPQADTLVYYMAGKNISEIARQILQQGRNPQSKAALIHNVSLPDQQVFTSTLKELSNNDFQYPTPVIVIITL
jgi:siroheme synthase